MSDRRRLLLGMAVLAVSVWAVYANSLRNPFQFDDWHVIQQNPEVRTPGDIPGFFVDVSKFSILPGNRDYRPLFLTSMALSWWVGGGSTLPFHLVSVALHTGSVLLLFLIARRLLARAVDPVGGLPPASAEWAAFLAALLFAVHPLATEAVVYLSSQSIPLAAFFYLLAFQLFLVTHVPVAGPVRPSRWWFRGGSYLAYCLALLSKPIAITLPVNLALWELLFGGAGATGGGTVGRRIWRRVARHLPYAAISIAYLLLRTAVYANPVQPLAGRNRPVAEALIHHITQTKALVLYYLKLALLPFGQSVDRDYPRSGSFFEPEVLLALGILAGLALLLVRYRRHRALVFFSLWFPTCLLVTTYLVVLLQTVREGRVYLSLAGICVLAGLLTVRLWDSLPERLSGRVAARTARALAAGLIALLVAGLAYGTRERNRVWSSALTLWGDAARKGGTWRAHMNYGLALENAGRADEALREFETAVARGPYAFAHINLGLAYVRRGVTEQGIGHLRTAVRLWPESPETHFYLARGLESLGDLAGAESALHEALERRPDYLLAHRSLGDLYSRTGRDGLALAAYQTLLELDPGQPEIAERVQQLQQAAAANPDTRTDFLFSRGFTLQRQGDRRGAIELYEELLTLRPDHRQVTFNLAYAYLAGDSPREWRRSVELFERVLEIDPGYTECLFHLATAHWKLGDEARAREYDRRYLERGVHDDLKQRSRDRLRNTG